MKRSISQMEAPIIAGVVRERTVRAAIAEIKNCILGGAGMIDLHMSTLVSTDTVTLRDIISASKVPVLALNYNSLYDWSDAGFTEQARAETFLRAVDAGAAGVDIQGYTFDIESKNNFIGEDKYSFTKNNPSEIVTDQKVIEKQCELIDRVHAGGAEVVLSCHPGISMTADQVVDLALFLEKRNPDVIKIVTRANNEDDLAESIRAMLALKKEVKTPVSYHANGACGALSRIINPLLGGKIAFCVDGYSESSTFEQMDLRSVKAIVENVKKIVEI